MALGFKVADGYVEVHARYDKGELRRAAQQAADDNDKAYNKERERNAKSGSTRDTNRRIGKQAADDYEKELTRGDRPRRAGQKVSRGLTDGMSEETRKSCTKKMHAALERCIDVQRVRQKGLGRRISSRIGEGLREGAGGAVAAFFTRFIEIASFGQADIGMSRISGPIAASFARIGAVAGLAFAGAVVVAVSRALVAALPLALGGALLAIPIISLIKKNTYKENGKTKFKDTEIGKSLKDFVGGFKKFAAALGKVFSGPFKAILENATRFFEAITKPMQRAVKAITPGAMKFFLGFLDGLVAFGKAMKPALPGINAGLKQWGKELPRIFKALGEAFSKLLKDPKKVQGDIHATSNLIIGLLGDLADLIAAISTVMLKYDELNKRIDKDKNGKPTKGGQDSFGAIGKIATDNAVVRKLDAFSDKIKKKIRDLAQWILHGGVGDAISKLGTKIKGKLDKIVADIGAWGDRVAAKIKSAQDKITKKAKGIVDGVVKWLKQLPGKAASAVGGFGDKIGAKIKAGQDKATKYAKDLVNKVVRFLKALPGKAASAITSLADKIGAKIKAAQDKATQKAKELVDGFIKKVKELPGKAKTAVGKVKGAVQSALSGAGKWLVGAGKALMNGLADGIRAGLTWVKNAAVTAAKAAVGAAKKALGIKSPSTVFAKQVGAPIMDGLVQGLKNASPKVAKWLKKFFDRIADKKTTKGVVDRLREIGKAYDKVLDGKNSKLDKIQAKLKAQKDLLTQLRDAAKEYAKSISESAVGDITQNISPGNIVGGLQARLASQTSFLANLEALKKLGLDQGALQQILDSGAGTGNAFAQALLSDPAQIAVVNELQAKLRVIGGKLGQFGSKTFHQAGINVAKGLVKGLESQEKQLIKAIEKLAHKLVAAFKKKLGIKSPSTVMAEEVGKPSAQGIGEGLRKQLPAEMDSIRHLVPRSVKRTSDGRAYHTTSNWNPTINVHVAAGLDPVNAAARRALTKDIFLALEAYRKDYVR